MEDYVNFETARLLKEAGFDWETTHYYTREDAPDSEVWLTSTPALPQNWNLPHEYPPFLVPRCSAPTLAQAQKWLREVKDCVVLVKPQIEDIDYTLTGKWYYEVWIDDNIFEASDTKDIYFDTYESALSAGIEAALKLIEDNDV